MIYSFFGDNSYARDVAVQKALSGREVTYVEADHLSTGQLIDLFAGTTLFDEVRVEVIRGLASSILWADARKWLEQVDDKSTYILVDDHVDKRTATYKWLVAHATVEELEMPTPRDGARIRSWLIDYASTYHVRITRPIADQMIARATHANDRDGRTVIDQQLLATVVTQLEGQREVTDDEIETVMPASTEGNVFGLLEMALHKDAASLHAMIVRLKRHEDGYRVLGLLISQTMSVAMLVLAGDTPLATVARDTGLSPYSLRGMERDAHQISRADARTVLAAFKHADEQTKHGQEPWQQIETALIKIALR